MYAVIDIGSNTIRLVIFRLEGGLLTPTLSSKDTAGLASYIDKRNCLSREGIHRLTSTLRRFRAMAEMVPDCPLYPFATASLRNIANTDQVLELVRQETGLEIRVLSGKEEATLDYCGAVRRTAMDSGLLVDVGGGSTELVFFRNRTILAAHSLPIGSLNLYSKYVDELLPKKKELHAMRSAVRRLLKDMPGDEKSDIAQPICGVGGTARAALALYQSLYGETRSGVGYDAEFLCDVLRLVEEEPRRLMRRILKVAPERIHTLLPGMLVLSSVAEFYGSKTVLTSSYGVREGYLSYILEKEGVLCE